MSQLPRSDRTQACAYEAVFCIFLAVMVYLGRENADFVYPTILYLFVLLLALNLAAIAALRCWPSREWISALVIAANCGTITAILSYSGGARSNLWVLYLLPIYTAALLLGGRETAWITAGATAFNTVICLNPSGPWRAAEAFEVCVKNGLFIFSAILTWRLASRERASSAKLLAQRRELERQTELVERNEGLAQMGLSSAAIVHDLKSPLVIIRAYADLCLSERTLDPEVRTDIERIKRSTVYCAELVEGILRAAGAGAAAGRSCEIHQRLESALELSGIGHGRSRIEVVRRFAPQALRVFAPPEQLERVFLNLLGNAAKAMPSGGRLTLRTSTAGDGGAGRVLIAVEDTGSGISDEALEKLFKPFGTTRPREGGTGLGLYLCREIALKNGGSLTAENAPSGGARFTLSLPLEGAPEPAASRRPEALQLNP